MAKITAGLDRLDEQYQDMKEMQTVLLQALEKLQREESSLSQALVLSREQSKPPRRPRKNDENAIQRLQDALLNADDSDDESSL